MIDTVPHNIMDMPSFDLLGEDPVCITLSDNENAADEPLATPLCSGFTRDETLILGEHLQEPPSVEPAQAPSSAQEEALQEAASATAAEEPVGCGASPAQLVVSTEGLNELPDSTNAGHPDLPHKTPSPADTEGLEANNIEEGDENRTDTDEQFDVGDLEASRRV